MQPAVASGTAKLKAEVAQRVDEIAQLLDGEWRRLAEREEQLARERAAFEAMRAKIASVHTPDKVKLCVGGTVFATSREHLMRDANSMLAAMFSGHFNTQPDSDGTHFIDRDPEHFPAIMNYLRHGKIQIPAGSAELADFLEEVEFYQLSELCRAAREALAGMQPPPPTSTAAPALLSSALAGAAPPATVPAVVPAPASVIAPATPVGVAGVDILLWSAMAQWVPNVTNYTLIFKASRDGWTSAAFHKACDGKSPTVTVFRCLSGHVFGAYTAVARTSSNAYIADPAAFLFTVTNPRNAPPARFAVKDASRAVWDGPNDLAVFGGHDIFSQRSATSTDGYMRFPLSFADAPSGAGRTTFTDKPTPLRLAELEVYQLTTSP